MFAECWSSANIDSVGHCVDRGTDESQIGTEFVVFDVEKLVVHEVLLGAC